MSATMNRRNIGNPAIDVPETPRHINLPNTNFDRFWAKRGQGTSNWNSRYGKGFKKQKCAKS